MNRIRRDRTLFQSVLVCACLAALAITAFATGDADLRRTVYETGGRRCDATEAGLVAARQEGMAKPSRTVGDPRTRC